MDESSIIILGLGNIIVGSILWLYFFRTYFADSHKYELSVLRNKIFDFAFENNISFDHPAIKDRLNEINSMIKISRAFFPAVLTSIFFFKKYEREKELYTKIEMENINSLPEEYRKFFYDNRREQALLFLSYFIKSSLVLIILSIIIVALFYIILFLMFFNNRMDIQRKFKNLGRPIINNFTYTALKTI